ncbi:hypothetical protein E2C01_046318 [Portunus trituberculatus]|uniref:Uncharacterized protein n=1 Tax=Portunus trituberculatus TaxID=210409 RepID=A0A5B7G4F7_PORTR|nr:hypothetical protein [Portunus trituberculatus]
MLFARCQKSRGEFEFERFWHFLFMKECLASC